MRAAGRVGDVALDFAAFAFVALGVYFFAGFAAFAFVALSCCSFAGERLRGQLKPALRGFAS